MIPLEELEPTGGELYAHVFENAATGLPRRLYWCLHVDFAPLQDGGELWTCSFGIEWMQWPVRRWSEVSGLGLAELHEPRLVESSLYVFEHHPAKLERLHLERRDGARFELSVAAVVPFATGGLTMTDLRLETRVELDFGGVVIVPDNLWPKPASAREAAAVAAEHLSLDDLTEPELDGHRYVLRPRSP